MIDFISEIGSNHNQDKDRCFKLIDEAKVLNFQGVKFQLFKAELLTSDKAKQKIYKKQELPPEWIPEISQYCKEIGIKFGCTPFDLESVDILKNWVNYFKISSFDILRENLIQKCIETGKDIMVSTGLATVNDIKRIMHYHYIPHQAIIFLHCTSEYPTSFEKSYIGNIKHIYKIGREEIFGMPKNIQVGYSDHTKNIQVIIEALNSYASVIEMHFDLEDLKGNESSYGHCWTKKELDILYTSMSYLDLIYRSNNFKLTEEQIKMRANAQTGLRE